MSVLPDSTIRDSYIEQAHLAQAHRWIAAVQGCERSSPLDNLLTPQSSLEVNGQTTPLGDRMLPQLHCLRVSAVDASGAALGQDLRIDATSLSFTDNPTLIYHATITLSFVSDDILLPLITKVTVATGARTDFSDDEAQPWVSHRMLLLKHRWHTLGECPVKTAPPYKDIISDDFVMDWGSGIVRGYAELQDWLKNSASSMAAARHDIEQFSWSKLDEDIFQPVFVFNWSGISLSGKSMQAKSRHTWRVLDDVTAAYPLIDHMHIEFLVPFHEVS